MAPRALLVTLVVALGLGGAAPSHSSTAGKALRVSSVNPRYFADSSGRAVYLTGSHVWWNLVGDHTWRVDCRYGAVKPFDYEDYLDRLVRYHHNFIRLWTIELTTWRECRDQVRVAPHAWRRTGPGLAFDGLPKFDLGRFDPAYFNRLRARVVAARKRGLYVAVMLFEGWGAQFQPYPWRSRAHPFHALNNINGLSPDRNRDGRLHEIYTLRSPWARRIQEAYVRKVVDTVGRFDNVLYEIANESGAFSIPWQYRMIDVVKRHQARRGGLRHPVGMTFVHGDWGGAALYRSKADWVAPKNPRHLTDPPVAGARKVTFSDTDHHGRGYGDPTFPWRTFMRGYNPILMDELTPAGWIEDIRYAMGNARRYADRVSLARMAPRGDLCSTGYCLVWPGREYLVYKPADGAFSVNLSAARRTFSLEWMHPVTGQITRADPVPGGASRTLQPPFAGPAVAYLAARP